MFNYPVTSIIMYIYIMVDCVADQWEEFQKW